MNDAGVSSAAEPPKHFTSGPYVGLRPFQERDSQLLFGRRQQVDALLLLLQKSRFLPIVGSSGCGKSSLVRAGLIPALKGGFLVRERDDWLVATITPGNTPLRNLATALCSLGDGKRGSDAVDELLEGIELFGSEALGDHLCLALGTRKNFLLCVDQFEEVFALRNRFANPSEGSSGTSPTGNGAAADTQEESQSPAAVAAKEQTDEFVALMLELSAWRDLPMYVVLTMRSDFLGDCDVFPGLPEALNEARYLVPRLTREQLRQAIEGPLKLKGSSLEPRLLDRLLDDVADRPDQLPVIQHALLRTWQKYVAHAEQRPVRQSDYEDAGTLDHALAEHADEALKAVPLALAERVFQALTDTDARQRRVRRSATVEELQVLTRAPIAELANCLQAFVADQRDFLTLSGPADAPETLVSITHESLIRRWKVLRKWVDLERSRKETYLSLAERAAKFQVGKAGRLPWTEINLAENWYREAAPTPEWVARYRGKAELAAVVAYIQNSRNVWRAQVVLLAGLVVAFIGLIIWSAVTNAKGQAVAVADAHRAEEARTAAEEARTAAEGALRQFYDVAKLFAAARSSDDDVALVVREMTDEGRNSSLSTWSEAASKALAWSAWQRFIPDAPAQAIATSPVDSRIAVAQADHHVTVWDTGKNPAVRVADLAWPKSAYSSPNITYTGVAFSADGKRIAATDSFKNYVVWPTGGGDAQVKQLPKDVFFAGSTAITSDLSRVTWGYLGKVRWWAPEEGKLEILNHGRRFDAPAFDSSGTWLGAVSDDGYGIWSARDGTPRRADVTAPGPAATMLAVRATPSGPEVALVGRTAALASEYGRIQQEFPAGGRDPKFSSDNRALMYSSAWGTLLYVLDASRSARAALPEAEYPTVLGRLVKNAVFDRTSTRVAGIASDGSVEIRIRKTAGRTSLISVNEVVVAAIGPNGELAAGDIFSGLRAWARGTTLLPKARSSPYAYRRPDAIAIDSAARRIALRTGKDVEIDDFEHGQISTRKFERLTRGPIALARDGRLALADYNAVALFQPNSDVQTELRTDATPTALAFDPNDKLLAVQCNGGLQLWSLADTNKPVESFPGGGPGTSLSGDAGALAFSSDGRSVASGTDDGNIRVWRQGAKGWSSESVVLHGHQGAITGLAFNADASRLVSASRDQTVRVWELGKSDSKPTGILQPLVLAGHHAAVLAAAFVGDRVLAVAADGTLTEWPATADALAQALWNVSRQCLSPSRRAELLHEPPGVSGQSSRACLARVLTEPPD